MAVARWGATKKFCWSLSAPTRRGPFIWVMAGAPLSAIRSAGFFLSAATSVVREFYVNDAGLQIKILGESIWGPPEAEKGSDLRFP